MLSDEQNKRLALLSETIADVLEIESGNGGDISGISFTADDWRLVIRALSHPTPVQGEANATQNATIQSSESIAAQGAIENSATENATIVATVQGEPLPVVAYIKDTEFGPYFLTDMEETLKDGWEPLTDHTQATAELARLTKLAKDLRGAVEMGRMIVSARDNEITALQAKLSTALAESGEDTVRLNWLLSHFATVHKHPFNEAYKVSTLEPRLAGWHPTARDAIDAARVIDARHTTTQESAE